MRTVRGVLVAIPVVTAFLLALVVLGLLPLRLGLLRGVIAEQLSGVTGVELDLEGMLRLRLGRTASLEIGGVSVYLPGAPGTRLAAAKGLFVSLDSLAALRGEIQLNTIQASGLQVDVCAVRRLEFPDSVAGEAALPQLALGQLRVIELALLCDGEIPGTNYWPQSISLTGSAARREPVKLQARIALEDYTAELQVQTATLQALLDAGEPLPLNLVTFLDAKGGGHLELHAAGTLTGLGARPQLQTALQLAVTDSAALLAPLGIDFPDAWGLHDLALQGAFTADKSALAVRDATVRVDRLEVATTASLELAGDCPELNIEATANGLDLEFFDRFIANDESLGGSAGAAKIALSSCGTSFAEQRDSARLAATALDIRVKYQQEVFPLDLDSITARLGYGERGYMEVNASWGEQLLVIATRTPSLHDLLERQDWPLELQANSNGAEIAMLGTLSGIGTQPRFAGTLEVHAPRTGDLSGWLDLPSTSDLELAGQMKFDLQREDLRVEELSLNLGRSAIAGSLRHRFQGDEPLLELALTSPMLDLDELAGLAGGAPETATTPTAFAATVDLEDLTWLEDWLRLPEVDFRLQLATVQGFNLRADDVYLTGNVKDRRIRDARLDLVYDEVSISGDLDADLGQRPWQIQYQVVADNIDIGRLLENFELAQGVTANARRLDVSLQTQGVGLEELVDNLHYRAQIDDLHWLPRALAGSSDSLLRASSLELNGHPTENTLWRGNASYEDVPLEFFLLAPPLRTLLDPKREVELQLALRSGKDVILGEATVAPHTGGALVMELDLSADTFPGEPLALESLQGPLQGARLRTRFSLEPGQLKLANLDLELASSRILGDIDVSRQDDQTRFAITLDSPFLETEDLVQPLAQVRHANTGTDVAATEPVSSAATARPAGADTGFIPMLNRQVSELAGQNEFRVKVTIDELQSAGVPLGKAHAELFMDGDQVILRPLSIALPQGQIEGNYLAAKTATGVQASLNLDIEKLSYGGLLRLLDAESEAEGTLFLQVDAGADAARWADLAGAIEGQAKLALFPENVEAGFLDLWASNLVLALLPTVDGENKKKMNCMVARLNAEKGVVESKNTFLDSTDIIVRLRGDIDLGRQQLNLLAVPQAKRERFLSVSTPLEIKGGFDDFTVAPAPGSFIMTMIRWYYGLIYVPWKWLTGDRFPQDGIATCYKALDWELPGAGHP